MSGQGSYSASLDNRKLWAEVEINCDNVHSIASLQGTKRAEVQIEMKVKVWK